ncbi:choice-of-anchor Q domain-containing protein, partial [Candidatus Margulisiibacteriota bacterium]
IFKNNYIDSDSSYGGAVYLYSGTLDASHCVFENNYVHGYYAYGGAIYTGGTIDASHGIFENNYTNGEYANGGALYLTSSDCNGSDCVFKNNYSNGYDSAGGAVCALYSDYNSNDSVFENNYVSGNYSEGGAIYINSPPEPIVFARTLFSGNSAIDFGGAVYIYSYYPSQGYNLIFYNNSAYQGGAIYTEYYAFESYNCDFVSNTAQNGGGAIYSGPYGYSYYNYKTVNSIYSGNSTVSGGSHHIYDGSGSGIDSYSCYFAPASGGLVGIVKGTGTISVDPEFRSTDPTNSYFLHLNNGSPCIDTGDPTFYGYYSDPDYEGNTRVVDGDIDMGAIEYQ